MDEKQTAGEKFDRLVDILAVLRGDDGCPWDREQDATSILNYFLEEVYEAADALRRGSADALREELGDVLMEVVFLCRIFEERGTFGVSDALDSINRKMVERHPHVFGGARLETSRRVTEEWQRSKLQEKGRESLLEGLPRGLPALLAAFQIGQRAASVGFDWPRPEDAWAKVREEAGELERAMARSDGPEVGREAGDLLLAVANFCRKSNINPELALRAANDKFVRRFARVERRLTEEGRAWGEATLEEMEALWEEVKAAERLE
jgi:tetrapyrrole methylase family protein/MazG family protein